MTGVNDGLSASRRFLASAQRMKNKWVAAVTYGSLGALFIGAYAIHAAGGSPVAVHTSMLVFAGVFYLGFVAWVRRPKKLVIDVAGDRLTVNQGAGGSFPLHGATLGEWYVPVMGTKGGMALHVTDGRHRFVLGGRNLRIDTGVRLEAAPVGSVDASISATDFDDLLTVLGHRRGLSASAAAVAGPIRCELLENSMLQRIVASWTGRRPQPKVCIEVDGDVIRLIDVKPNALIAWAALSQITVTPGEHTYRGRFSSITWAVLDIRVPGLEPMVIANPEGQRYMWRRQVPDLGNPDFILSTADWCALVERFGLTLY
jgi:hypothetical protein